MALVRLHSVRDFFRILYYWKKQAIAIFIIMFALIMLFAYVYTPDYTTSAKIMILPHSNDELVVSTTDSKNVIYPVSAQDVNTEIELLTSSDVLRETVQSFADTGKKGIGLKVEKNSWVDRMVDKAKYYLNEFLIFLKLKVRLSAFDANVILLSDSLDVEPVAASNVILVSLKAEVPKVATIVLNRLLDIYVAHHNQAYTKDEATKFLGTEARGYQAKMEDAEKMVKDYQKEWNIFDLKKQIEINIGLIAEFKKDLKQSDLAYESMRNRVAILKEDMAKSEQDFVITREMRNIPAVVELEKSIVPLLVTRSDMIKTYNQSSREFKDLETQISVLKGEIRKEIIKAIKTDELEIAVLKNQRESIRNQIAKLNNETELLNQKERDLTNLDREAKMLESNYKLYSEKTEDARIYSEMKKQDLASVSIVGRPVVPVKPSFPNRVLMLIVSVFVGFSGALGTPFLLEFLDHRIKTADEVESILSLPVVCNITEGKNLVEEKNL